MSVADQVNQAWRLTNQTFKSKVTIPYSYRIAQLKRLLLAIKKYDREIKDALQMDLGRSNFLAEVYEISTMNKYINYVIQNLKRWMKPEETDLDMMIGPGKSYIIQEPYGVALIMGAWNVPFTITLDKLSCAIAAGNAAVIKPSEISPTCAQVLFNIIQELDTNAYQCILGGPECAVELLKQRWDIIAYTGSSQKGKLVAQAAAEHLTKTILELGGKNPAVVDSNVNLQVAAKRLVQGRCINSGQACVAPEIILVFSSIKESFIQAVLESIKEFYGENTKLSQDIGRIVNTGHARRIQELLQTHNGQLLCGGDVDVDSRFVPPTVILNPALDSAIMKEEIFGPVMLILPVQDIDEAIDFINERENPLALYYFGDDSENREKLRNSTSSGNFSVYECVLHYSAIHMPFGGVGNSGMGQYHGKEGFYNFSHPKSVLYKSSLNMYPLTVRYPPYTLPK